VKSVRWLSLAALVGAGACAKGIPLPDTSPTVKVPAGTFIIGGGPQACPAQTGNCGSTTGSHPVVLSQPFDIEVHEVTIGQYQACVELGHCCGDASDSNYANNGDLPAQVRIDQARQYCQYRNRRLPTEAEWEVSARVKDATGAMQAYPWGDTPLACGQIPSQDCRSGNQELAPVGSSALDKTGLGIFDMAGNVAEWVEDDFTLGVGCRFQVALGPICSGDTTCTANMCNTPAGCQTECQGGGFSGGCGGSLANGGDTCPTVPAGEGMVDPFVVTYDHGTPAQNSGCQNSSPSSSAPMSKGGGVWEPSCAQNPAMRTSQQGYGSSGGSGNGGRQLGFRCVQRGTSPSLPRATGTARLSLSTAPTCGVIEIASVTPDTPPSGWGTQTRVALGSPLGWAIGKYDTMAKKYTIDLNDKQVFPGTPCPVTNYQPTWNGSGFLVLSGVPVTSFDVQIKYPAQSGSSNCVLSYTQTVNLLGYQNSCSGIGPPSGAYCP
jgi:formylglycine-generating enzyme required for sulfatase activity